MTDGDVDNGIINALDIRLERDGIRAVQYASSRHNTSKRNEFAKSHREKKRKNMGK